MNENYKRWLESLPDDAEPRRVLIAPEVSRREDGTLKISGYAAVFNSDSEDLGFIETIKPGAFKKALRRSDVRALFNHDANLIIGRSGVNLHLKEDSTGLHMTVDPIETSTYRMVAENISAGLVTQQSFAFTVSPDGSTWNDDFSRRTITEVDEVFDVSPVTYPAYSDTTVALRSRDDARGTLSSADDPAADDLSIIDKELFARINQIKARLKR